MPRSSDLPDQLFPPLSDITHAAGELALRFFQSGLETSARTWSKAGGSPVTEADVAVDTFLKVKLSQLLPEAAWLSEETADDARRIGRELVWIVDPIDGTRAFMAGSHDWSIAIALLADAEPILGIVYAPAHGVLYAASAGRGARRDGEPISVSAAADPSACSVAGPKPIVDKMARRHPEVRRLPRVPSLALRIVRVAEGSIDVGLVTSGARDWDIAAADLILREAGGVLTDMGGLAPPYNRPEPSHAELVAAPARLQPLVIEAITAR